MLKQEFLRIYKVLQTIRSKLMNNTSKLTEINKCIKKDSKNLKQIEDDPTYSEEQRQNCQYELDNFIVDSSEERHFFEHNDGDTCCTSCLCF